MADKNTVGLSYQPPQDTDLMNLVFPELKTPVVDNTYTNKYFNYDQETSGVGKLLNYNDTAQTGLVPEARYLARGAIPGTESDTIGDWFSQNKVLVGAGLGLGQLGLGYLNYTADKKGLESDLKSAEQARRLNEEAAQNKRNIQNKAQSALRFA